ncbi:MAG: dihydroorotate dehydrogenase [Candidatus Marinimicrobia bacterium]|nr:dihydroorotate dehydrogenase [Candidatus Neomarinimicrobiota bacterium]
MRSREEIRNYLLNGEIKLATVSGVLTTKPALIRRIDEDVPAISVITTKSYQVRPNPGNREPIVAEVEPGSYINAVGLRNPGMQTAFRELRALLKESPLRALLNISVSGNSPEEFIRLVKKFSPIADILELNFSCPHAQPGYGASIGSDAKLVAEYLRAIRAMTDRPLFPKLTPNVKNIAEIARAAVQAGADGIVAVNTFGPEAYREPQSGELLLYNPNDHKGGLSGEHIFDRALQKVREIREALGPDIPLIGMGGVSKGAQLRLMQKAGANVVGIGSAFARVKTRDYQSYLEALIFDAENHTDSAAAFVSVKRQAKYRPYRVVEAKHLSAGMLTLELEGEAFLFEAGQYAFLWIPGAGEKPLGLVSSSPLRFIIRKREHDPAKRAGEFTHAAFQIREGDTVYVRGPYGKCPPLNSKTNALILSGGTGVALVPRLAEHLNSLGRIVRVFHGVIDEKEAAYRELIENYAEYRLIPDKGKPGRVLDALSEVLDTLEKEDCAVYAIGPDILMEKALALAVEKGCASACCFASLENNHMCGIGMCGECECGGVLSCKDGTFYDYEFLKKHYFPSISSDTNTER